MTVYALVSYQLRPGIHSFIAEIYEYIFWFIHLGWGVIVVYVLSMWLGDQPNWGYDYRFWFVVDIE